MICTSEDTRYCARSHDITINMWVDNLHTCYCKTYFTPVVARDQLFCGLILHNNWVYPGSILGLSWVFPRPMNRSESFVSCQVIWPSCHEIWSISVPNLWHSLIFSKSQEHSWGIYMRDMSYHVVDSQTEHITYMGMWNISDMWHITWLLIQLTLCHSFLQKG